MDKPLLGQFAKGNLPVRWTNVVGVTNQTDLFDTITRALDVR
ncbi:hypothetical protein [Kutzneria albida]|uniref:Uncharacterized protein n=1 Tax=Kutzneria albida DSM 43870 TaxID=1449976 RepID=W5WC11_9PSEU|nr:hypothetical protein [Kutzneria albida]AHH98442.1 hypothetical protein KALB_5080 [Kutzneria albida DSM 43870]